MSSPQDLLWFEVQMIEDEKARRQAVEHFKLYNLIAGLAYGRDPKRNAHWRGKAERLEKALRMELAAADCQGK